MATTIQISNELKEELSRLKKDETYEDVIRKLLRRNKKMIVAEQMEEYGKEHGEESLKELKEWEKTELEW